MKTLFFKSNIPHIRTNAGEFEVSNPEEFEGAWVPLGVTLEQYFNSFENTNHPEWPGGVELIETCKWRGNRDACANEVCWDLEQCQGNPTIKLARLLPPKEEKKPEYLKDKVVFDGARTDSDTPMSFTESAYKEFEPHLPCVPAKKKPDLERLAGKLKPNYNHAQRIKPIESSEPQEKRCKACEIERNDEQVKQMPEHTCKKGSPMDIAQPKSAPSESQEEPDTLDDGTRPEEPQEDIWKEIIFACREARNPSYEELQNWFQKHYLITRNP